MKKNRIISVLLSTTMLITSLNVLPVISAVAESAAEIFSDNFSEYTSENAQTEAYTLYNGKKTLGTNGKASWVTSSVWVGNNSENPTADRGFAYIDETNDRLYLQGRWGSAVSESRYAAVNLDFGDTPLDTVTKVDAKLTRNGTRMSAIRLFVSENEKSYIEFGAKNNEPIGISSNGSISDELNNFEPFIRVGTGTNTLTNVLKVGDEGTSTGDVEWTYDAGTILEWTISVDNSSNTIAFKCINIATGAYWSGSFVDAYGIINSEWKYPVAFAVTGDGEAKPAYLDSFEMQYTEKVVEPECDFYDDFSAYTAENAQTQKYTLYNGKKVLGTNEEASWTTSSVWVGNSSTNPTADKGFAYIDDTNNRLHLQGRWGGAVVESRYATVNLDFGKNIKFKSIDRVKAVLTRNGTRMSSLRMFVSKDEKSYFEFGAKNNEGIGIAENGDIADGLNDYQPFIRVGTGTKTLTNLLKVGGADTSTGDVEWTYNAGDLLEWDISVDNESKVISFTCTNLSTGAYWSGSFEDTYGIIDSSWKYPVAFATTGDGETKPAYISELKLWYTEDENYVSPDFSEDFSGFKSSQSGSLNLKELVNNDNTTIAERADGVTLEASKIYFGGFDPVYKGAVNIGNGTMYLLGYGHHRSAVNISYDNTDTYIGSLEKICFTASRGGTRMAGMKLFVSGDEKTYYEIGIKNSEVVFPEAVSPVLPAYVPYVAKSVNGNIEIINYDNTGIWESGDSTAVFEITADGDTLAWTVKSTTGKTWSASHIDTDGIVSADWRYPASFITAGDTLNNDPLNAAYFTDVEMWYTTRAAKTYSDGEWNEEQFNIWYDELSYSSRPSEIYNLLGKEFSKSGSASATVSIREQPEMQIEPKLLSVQCEFTDSYDTFFNTDGTIKAEVGEYLKKSAPIKSWRWGGGTSNHVNLLNTITPYGGGEREASVYLSEEYLPKQYKSLANTESRAAYRMGVVEYIKVQQMINKDSSFVPCISLYTMTPEDVVEFLKFMTSEESYYVNWRKANGLSGEALTVDYVELGNEIDWKLPEDETVEERTAWYTQRAKVYIDAINTYNKDIKIVACGPTAPWGDESRAISWINSLAQAFGNKIYALSYHPYYYGHAVGYIINELSPKLKAAYDETAGSGSDIKIIATEHARNWDNSEETRKLTSGMLANTSIAYFLLNTAKKDYFGGAYYHSWLASTYLWMFYANIGGKWIDSGANKMYNMLSGVFDGTVYDTEISLGDNSDKVSSDFDVLAVKKNSREINIAMVNRDGYYDVDVSFDIPSEYRLASEKVYTAPNIFTFAYDETAADMMNVTEYEYTSDTAFTSYTLPRNSVVVLTLKRNDGMLELTEKFTTDVVDFEINDDMVFDEQVQDIVVNNNGTKWSVVPTKTGEYSLGSDWCYSQAAISNNNLCLTTETGSDELAVNWNVSDYFKNGEIIKEISFTVDDDAEIGGVRLFTDEYAESGYDFNTALSGLSGTVNWTVTVSGDTLLWTASNGTSQKSGFMPYTEQEYIYLMSVYSQDKGSVYLKDISVLYEEMSGITVSDNSTVDITVIPACYTADTIMVITAFYNDKKELVNVVLSNVDKTLEQQTFNITKPNTYTSVKVMIWDGTSTMKALDDITEF